MEELRSALSKRDLYLRNFNGDAVGVWVWTGNALVPAKTPSFRMIGGLSVNKVEVSHELVIIDGTRRSLERDGSKLSLTGNPVPTRLILQVPHDQQATVLPQVASLLFFPTREEAVASLPHSGPKLTLRSVPKGQGTAPKEECDCEELGTPSCEGKRPLGLKHPVVLSSVDLVIPDEARQAHVSKSITVLCTVGLSGRCQDIWIMNSVGLGLEESAVDAVRHYTFRPAMCHDRPKAVPFYIDLNYTLF